MRAAEDVDAPRPVRDADAWDHAVHGLAALLEDVFDLRASVRSQDDAIELEVLVADAGRDEQLVGERHPVLEIAREGGARVLLFEVVRACEGVWIGARALLVVRELA